MKLGVLFFLFCMQMSAIQAYFFNAKPDGVTLEIGLEKDANRVLANATLNLAIFDERRNFMCLADTAEGKGTHSLMSVNFFGSNFARSGIATLASATTVTSPQLQAAYQQDEWKPGANFQRLVSGGQLLKNRAIKKIAFDVRKNNSLALVDLDLFVLPAKQESSANSKLYVIKTPATNPVIYQMNQLEDRERKILPQLVVSDNACNLLNTAATPKDPTKPLSFANPPAEPTEASVPCNILDFVVTGYDDTGRTRVVMVVSGDPNKEDLLADSKPERATMRTFLYDSKTNLFQDSGRSVKLSDDQAAPLTLDTTTDQMPNLGCLTGAFVGGVQKISGLYWDDRLQRLYFGITLHSADSLSAVPHSFIMIARFDAFGNLICDKFSPSGFGSNVFGFPVSNHYAVKDLKITNGLQVSATRPPLRYLIASLDHQDDANGQTPQISEAARAVYCVPIVDAPTAKDEDLGKLAKVTAAGVDRNTPASNALQSYANQRSLLSSQDSSSSLAYDIRSLVGGAPFPGDARDCGNISFLADGIMMLNTGNSLQAGADDEKALLGSIGTWASKPIYDADGEIKAWTTWTRAFPGCWSAANDLPMTSPAIMKHAFVSDGSLYFVGGSLDGSATNLLGFMDWNPPLNNINPFNCSNLFGLLNKHFAGGGIWTAKHFPATKTTGNSGNHLLIFGSREKLVVASTGGYLSAENYPVDLKSKRLDFTDVSYLNADFSSSKYYRHYVLFSELDDLGGVLCTEISRATCNANNPNSSTNGHIFIGGGKGLAVLRRANGEGFPACENATDLENLTKAFAAMTFKRIPQINEPIHDLVSTHAFLYALGRRTVYRIRLHSDFNPVLFAKDATPATAGVSNTMFSDKMDVVVTPPDQDLSAANFPADKLVVQIVKRAAPNEYFVGMTHIWDTGAIILASMQGEKSNLYAIKDGEAVQVEGSNAKNNIYLTDTTAPDAESSYRKVLPYPVRRMYINNGNITGSSLLGDGFGNFSSVNSTFGANADGSLLYGPIANLYVMSGSIFGVHSKVYVYPLAGTFDKTTDKVILDDQASWISTAPIPGLNGLPVGILANGLALEGVPYIYAHASDGSALNILTMFSQKTPMVQKYCGLTNDAKVFGSVRLSSGTQMLFGYPFAVATYE